MSETNWGEGFIKAMKEQDCVAEQSPSPALSDKQEAEHTEASAFEEWASRENYDMTTHPLHWLFLNERTYAARQGWKAALNFAAPQAKSAPITSVEEFCAEGARLGCKLPPLPDKSAPSGEEEAQVCAECGLSCTLGNCIFFPPTRGSDLAASIESLRPYSGKLLVSDRDSYVVGFAKAIDLAATLARRDTVAPNSAPVVRTAADLGALLPSEFMWGDALFPGTLGEILNAYDARRATAGTTAAPSIEERIRLYEILSRIRYVEIDEATVMTKEVLGMFDRRATAGNAAPTDAEPVYFFRQKGTDRWIESEADPRESFAGSPAALCMEYRTLYASSDLATPAAAPGDLPPLPSTQMIGQNHLGLIYGYSADQMKAYGKACIASTARAAPLGAMAALRPFAEAYAPEARRMAKYYTDEDLAKYGARMDANTITPSVTMGDFRRAHEAYFRTVPSPASQAALQVGAPRESENG